MCFLESFNCAGIIAEFGKSGKVKICTISLDTTAKFTYPSRMDAQFAIDLCQHMVWTGLMIGMPILLSGVVIGLIVGLLQALTQIQEQTIATVLKIVVMMLVAAYTMPWMAEIMIERATDIFFTIPRIIPD